jgi:hypothetical protein
MMRRIVHTHRRATAIPSRGVTGVILLAAVSWSGCATSRAAVQHAPAARGTLAPLQIQAQGSFAVGGTMVTSPGTFDPIAQGAYSPTPDPRGQSLRGDHASVAYQIPVNARQLPLVFWHGHGQSSRTWSTTPDGREGFQTLFLRRGFPVYLLDQPRRGLAARGTVAGTVAATPDEQMWFGVFRLGVWPDFYPGVQFSRDSAALNQFFRQAAPNTAPYDVDVNTSAVAALFDRLGAGILVTHSQSGALGWRTVLRSDKVRGIVAFEPGGDYVFPTGEAPAVPFGTRTFTPPTVPQSEFLKLTKIPIVIYYGDNIPDQPSTRPGEEQWRVFVSIARQWRDVVNRHGGDVTLIELPRIGITGNTHFPMSDLNNVIIADQVSSFLRAKGLDLPAAASPLSSERMP